MSRFSMTALGAAVLSMLVLAGCGGGGGGSSSARRRVTLQRLPREVA